MPQLDVSRMLLALAELRAAPPDVFGANAHGFQLNSPLPEEGALAFERAHGVLLPADYRQFLTQIGNGGAGPFYGVFPLGCVDDNMAISPWSKDSGLVGDLSKPFPLKAAWNDLTGQPSSHFAQSSADPEETENDRQWESFTDNYWRTELINGAIPICHQGCALRTYLVVSGPQTGYLWNDMRAEFTGINPVRLADGARATFSGWYDEWLASCLAARLDSR